MRKLVFLIVYMGLAANGVLRAAEPAGVSIGKIEPTPLFPQVEQGQQLKQMARLHVDNAGEPIPAVARVTVGSGSSDTQDLGVVAKGKSAINILIPDMAVPAPVTIEILAKDGTSLAVRKADWKPQKKWTIYSVSYSHQDLGFGDYPHRLRPSIRHENIRLPLRFCRETDTWPSDSQSRFNIETSEALTSFISFNGKDAAHEGRTDSTVGPPPMHATRTNTHSAIPSSSLKTEN